MITHEEVYKIGKIGKPHGVKGELTLQFIDDVFDRTDADFLVLDIDGILVPFFFEEYRFRSDTVALVKFCDIDTQEQARPLTGCNVYFMREYADGDDEQLSWAQIVGFRIIDSCTGKAVGTITYVDDSTINLLFEVLTEDGKELLLPASEDLIVSVNAGSHEIEMALPEGILEL